MHAYIYCENYKRLPKTLRLYQSPEKWRYEITWRRAIGLNHNCMLLIDTKIKKVSDGKLIPVTSLNEFNMGSARGIYAAKEPNPAKITQIELYSKDATFIASVNLDGSIRESNWHGV